MWITFIFLNNYRPKISFGWFTANQHQLSQIREIEAGKNVGGGLPVRPAGAIFGFGPAKLPTKHCGGPRVKTARPGRRIFYSFFAF